MTFDPSAQLDPDRVSSGGGGGRGLAVGGGVGGVVVLLLALVFGVDPSALTEGGGTAAPDQGVVDVSNCTTGQAANTDVECRIVATAASLDAVWTQVLPTVGAQYVQPGVQLFVGSVQTGCGAATTEVGPFYCPADSTAYFDTGFFSVLTDRFGSSGGPLAQEYVVAHEFGHHVQHELGLLDAVQRDPQGAESAAVRSELQADCLAGVWAHHASTTPDPATGRPFLLPLTDADVADALSAASSVGDDRIQQSVQGRTDPETYTHGTSAQRQRWFTAGYRSGEVGSCDTFSAAQL